MQAVPPQTLADVLAEPTPRQRQEAALQRQEQQQRQQQQAKNKREKKKQRRKKAVAARSPFARRRRRRQKRRRRRRSQAAAEVEGVVRRAKSRPAAFAQTCLAFEKHVLRCQSAGMPFQLTPEALLQITHDQAGSKAHHLPQQYNTRDNADPLKHILVHSTLCGAGKDTSVFRPDVHHYGIRAWPEGCLIPILDSLDRFQQAWAGTDIVDPRPSAAVEDLTAPNGQASPAFPAARPLW